MRIETTTRWDKWYARLKDDRAVARIKATTKRWRTTGVITGDIKPVGQGVYELRIHVGAGYRIYYTRYGDTIVLLLTGGNKTTQARDIAAAHILARQEESRWHQC